MVGNGVYTCGELLVGVMCGAVCNPQLLLLQAFATPVVAARRHSVTWLPRGH